MVKYTKEDIEKYTSMMRSGHTAHKGVGLNAYRAAVKAAYNGKVKPSVHMVR